MTTLPRNKIKNNILGLKINFSIIPYIDKTTGKNCVHKSRGVKKFEEFSKGPGKKGNTKN